MDMNLSDVRSRNRRPTYRHHSLEYKRDIVEQSLQPEISVARLAREHGLNANQVFSWRKAYREGRLERTVFLPVTVRPDNEAHALMKKAVASPTSGRLVIERSGTRLIVEGQPDAQVLRQILTALLQ